MLKKVKYWTFYILIHIFVHPYKREKEIRELKRLFNNQNFYK